MQETCKRRATLVFRETTPSQANSLTCRSRTIIPAFTGVTPLMKVEEASALGDAPSQKPTPLSPSTLPSYAMLRRTPSRPPLTCRSRATTAANPVAFIGATPLMKVEEASAVGDAPGI